MTILDAIGNTSLVQLRKLVPSGYADVLVKLEWENPSGSLKDRMGKAVVERAETDGRLKPGYTLVEYTGGSTGASLAMVCAAKGYRTRIVSSARLRRMTPRRWRGLAREEALFTGTSGGANVIAAS